MKLVTDMAAVLFVLGAAAAVPAHAQATCSNASLSGDYSIAITGAILAGPVVGPVNGVNLTHFDGMGGLASVDHVIINGALGGPGVDWRTGVGTYSLNANCTGQASFTYPDGQTPGLSYYFVLTRFSRQMDIVVSTPGFNITAGGTKKT